MPEEIDLMDGVKLVIDPEKFSVLHKMKVQLPNEDLQVSFDLNVTDVLQHGESKVQNLVTLRSK